MVFLFHLMLISWAWAISPWQELGIPEGSSLEEIKSAYHKKVKAFHPDIAPPGKAREFTEKLQKVNLAYEELRKIAPAKKIVPPPTNPLRSEEKVLADLLREFNDKEFEQALAKNEALREAFLRELGGLQNQTQWEFVKMHLNYAWAARHKLQTKSPTSKILEISLANTRDFHGDLHEYGVELENAKGEEDAVKLKNSMDPTYSPSSCRKGFASFFKKF